VAATTMRIAHPYTEEHARQFLQKRKENKFNIAAALPSCSFVIPLCPLC